MRPPTTIETTHGIDIRWSNDKADHYEVEIQMPNNDFMSVQSYCD